MAAKTDFWGEIDTQATARTPLSIMREQAALLGLKTNNMIEARVNTNVVAGSWFLHSFDLVVPALKNYIYGLFSIEHGAHIYPVTLLEEKGRRLDSEGEFEDWLSSKLSSRETKLVIANLLSQVKA